ncbi:hypothetical protein CANARDRAFT_178744, partial [[Candida] arabinofermentans NRRL YB-2248]
MSSIDEEYVSKNSIDQSVGSSPEKNDAVPPLPARSPTQTIHEFPLSQVLEEESDHDEDKPALPKRPSSILSHANRGGGKYGMKRTSIEDFELASPVHQKGHGRFPSLSKNGKSKSHLKNTHTQENEFKLQRDKNLDYLVLSREAQVEAVYKQLDEDLIVSNDVYYGRLRSNDSLIELMSEVEAGQFDHPDRSSLYSLILKTMKLQDDFLTISDSKTNVNSLPSNTHPLLDDDLSKINRLTGKSNLNPLVIALHTELKSPKITSIFSLLFESAISSSQLFTKLLPSVIHQMIVYGVHSIIDTLIAYLFDAENLRKIRIKSDLVNYSVEFNRLINPPPPKMIMSNDSLIQQRAKLKSLTKELSTKNRRYDELLINYKQLNEERFNNDSILKKLQADHDKLKTEFNQKDAKLSSLLSNFEAIKQNNDKNIEISKMNELLKKDIAKLMREISALKKK